MLKIAPNPDAAYEICTIFAPDCKRQLKDRMNYSASSSRNDDDYEEENEKDSERNDTVSPVRINMKRIKLVFKK